MRPKSKTPTTQAAAIRTLKVLKLLKGHALTGLSNGQIAQALDLTPSAVTLSLNSLESEGLVAQLENGRYTHSIAMLQIAQAHADHVNRMQNRINEINARVAAGAYN